MLYKVIKHTYIRAYSDFGYICNMVTNNDLIVDNSGKLFLLSLSKECQSFGAICETISKSFNNLPVSSIEPDVLDFLTQLESEGYIVSGKSLSEVEQKEKEILDTILHKTKKNVNYVPLTKQQQPSSRVFLRDYFAKKPHLVSVQIEVSNTCNERCIHCYIPHENKNTHLDYKLFNDILIECRDLGAITILLTGGEPMMHPQFKEMLHLISNFDFEVKILSNLTLLTDEIIELLKNSNCTGIQASLYSMNPKIHDTITCKEGSFDKTTSAIRHLLNAGIPVQLSCVIMKQNKNCYKDVLKWGNDLGIITTIDYVLMGRSDFTTSNLNHRLDLTEIEAIIRETLEYDICYKDRVINSDIQEIINSYRGADNICNVCRTTIGIAANGNVYPCVGWQGYVLGNLNFNSLSEIWDRSPKACKLRNIKKEDFAECHNCDKKAFCSMCLVRNANENSGNYLKINRHTCDIAEINKKIVLEYKNLYGRNQ